MADLMVAIGHYKEPRVQQTQSIHVDSFLDGINKVLGIADTMQAAHQYVHTCDEFSASVSGVMGYRVDVLHTPQLYGNKRAVIRVPFHGTTVSDAEKQFHDILPESPIREQETLIFRGLYEPEDFVAVARLSPTEAVLTINLDAHNLKQKLTDLEDRIRRLTGTSLNAAFGGFWPVACRVYGGDLDID